MEVKFAGVKSVGIKTVVVNGVGALGSPRCFSSENPSLRMPSTIDMTDSRHGILQNMFPTNQKTDSRENIPLLQINAQKRTDIGPLSYPVTSSVKPSGKSMVPKMAFSEEDSSAFGWS